jgi:hypothetical protein
MIPPSLAWGDCMMAATQFELLGELEEELEEVEKVKSQYESETYPLPESMSVVRVFKTEGGVI